MADILYATGNDVKFHQAQVTCGRFGLTLQQHKLNVPEIQAETGEPIALDKATKAFAKFQKPVVISDDNWSIPALKGFPGPYMKSMNDWFSVDDWLNLTRSLADRRIVLRQIVVYQDADEQKMFYCDLEGIILTEARGESPYPHSYVTSFDGGKTSNAEFHQRGESATSTLPNVWNLFAEWYKEKHAA